MCKLLALKADDKGTDPEKLIYEIYLAADQMKDKLTNDQLLLIEQWINAYKKVPDKALESIKKEVKMDMIATTISEHIFLEGKNKGKSEGKAEGRIEGKTEGKIEGKIEILENLFLQKILTREQFEKAVEPLRQQLKELME
ncbi:Uncharacterized protein dnl_46100 [Desulfonema limicola]|uniref:Uncharacterized protein n=1 Tax=Desulfonema limicola TaxID=45656 RepID=A0A975BBG9_9BACT|nr:hypothetical protein [Desulfonema limicola]QTA82233.1 Uncharacterized protein dnl_46060 [Desulfonema limicola]QTA82237.1 Uncharacterized protein dnl_46100 [Desulfonema limicola]